jgi:phosphoglycolate phosphatase
MIKLIIFDLDGTLVNAYKAVAVSVNKVLSDLNIPEADDATIQREVGWGERKLLNAFISDDLLDNAVAMYRKYHKQALSGNTFFLSGAKELIDIICKRGYTLAVATNRPVWSTKEILDCLGIRDRFKIVLSGEQVKNQKPAPDIIFDILEKLSVKKGEALFVGDMTVDAQTGNAAGVKTVIVTTGSSTREEIERESPFKIVDNVYDVVSIVEGIR